jgi:hypothetical protein
MEILLLGVYSFFVWLIFIKLKLLPWTTPNELTVLRRALLDGLYAHNHSAAKVAPSSQ